MHPTNCLNCATLLTADDHYCPTCGQKTDTHRISMSHIWHDLTHAITHADRGVFFTLRELLLRPGTVAREYLAGKRKKYFNPFSLLILIVGIYILANSVFKPYSQDVFTPKQTPSWVNTEAKKRQYNKLMEKRHEIGDFMNHHVNIVLFVSTPFFAAIFWLLFRRRGYNYAEHLTTMAYVNSFLSVITILIFAPLMYFIGDRFARVGVYIIMLLIHLLYISFMYYGFNSYSSRKEYLKVAGASILALVCWSIFAMVIGILYIIATI